MLDTGTHHFGLAKDRISQETHSNPKLKFCVTGMMLQLKGRTSYVAHKKENSGSFYVKLLLLRCSQSMVPEAFLPASVAKQYFSSLDFCFIGNSNRLVM